jgi:hypothetical protein
MELMLSYWNCFIVTSSDLFQRRVITSQLISHDPNQLAVETFAVSPVLLQTSGGGRETKVTTIQATKK